MPVRGSTHALRLHPGKAQIAGAPPDDVTDDKEEEDEEELLPPCPPAQAAIAIRRDRGTDPKLSGASSEGSAAPQGGLLLRDPHPEKILGFWSKKSFNFDKEKIDKRRNNHGPEK